MKLSHIALSTALLLAAVVPAAARVVGPEAQTASYDFGPTVNNFALSIKLDSATVNAGSPIGGVLAIKNFGPPATIFRLGTLEEYKLTGQTPSGSPLEKSGPGVPFSGSVSSGLNEDTGAIYIQQFDDLGKWYDLKKPGTYAFYAQTALARGLGGPILATLTSSTVTLIVR
ncbi:MAG: hypothetical protein JOY86_05900 [Candidatus Eremiobacteraeota bacterium]|nr:hypothetical protein [Candidatus Eremiobacteraeota bacterium]